ncbi:MAG TPA: flippase activity-associated protein Agl23 [Bdellovibrionales bacterium]|nr:flippase activity-associated protein Agl23 [Bdellovibrionales bacterium]
MILNRRSGSLILLIILAAALALRSIGLELKPTHFDEGINGNFVFRMWSDGFYRYDPNNFHGPLYFYILQLAETVFGFGIFGYRFATGLLSLAIIYIIGSHRRFVGNSALWAAAVYAVSPASVFYSRYAIHETLFILSHVAFAFGYLLWREERSNKAWAWMAAAVVTAVTTKETFFIFFGTWAIAIFVDQFATKLFKLKVTAEPTPPKASPVSERVAINLVAAFVTLALFTGFFMNLQGAQDMFTALMIWTKTGTGATGHEKEFRYWIDLMNRYEWPFLVALVLTPVVYFRARSRAMRLFTLVGFGTWLAYSLIPYKTPWLILNILWPLSFVFGFLICGRARWLEEWLPKKYYLVRLLFIVALLFTMVSSIRMTMWLNFDHYNDLKEPYVYVQTTDQFKVVMDTISALVEKRPEERGMSLAVLNQDPWPMPWVLSRFPRLSWGKAGTTPLAGFDVVLADASDTAVVESGLQGRYLIMPFQIRDAYQIGHAYLIESKFKDVVPKGTPDRTFGVEQAVKK